MNKIGIDLGGTKIEGIVLDSPGNEIFRKRINTPRHQGYRPILNTLISFMTELQEIGGSDSTFGMGIPGIIDATGHVTNANTTELIGHPLKDDLQYALGKSVIIENDANCFTLAESVAGAGKDYEFVFGVILGTGCGGGIAIHQQVRNGPHGIAGEWGHFAIDPGGEPCYCGNTGCIETKISGSGIEKLFYKKYNIKKTMKDILEGYRNHDPVCTETMHTFFDDYGRSLGGLISILDPDCVVIGGGLSNIKELYTEGYAKIKQYVFFNNLKTPVLKNKLGDSAGVIGAAWIGCP